jgi:acyl-CoA synthetase (AMP-forming)/AMP-acid ligase II
VPESGGLGLAREARFDRSALEKVGVRVALLSLALVKQPWQEEIIAFCSGRIARYKIPRYVRFVAEFPMTVRGKAQKFVMREQMKRGLAVEDAPAA